MRWYICLTLLFSTSLAVQAQTVYTAHDLNITFYSSTPLKNFDAYSTSGTSTLSTEKKEVSFSVEIASFVFYRLLMQEHFNRKYMESDRFPRATFKGRFSDDVDFSKKGRQAVTVQGILDIHGKKHKREIDGYLTIGEEEIFLESTFMVTAADHGITIPASLSEQIAPDIQVKVRGEYAPYDQLVKK